MISKINIKQNNIILNIEIFGFFLAFSFLPLPSSLLLFLLSSPSQMSTPKTSTSTTPNRLAKEAALEDYAWEESLLTSADVLQRPVPWERLASGGVIDAKELAMVTRLLSVSGESQWKLLEESGDAFGLLLLGLVGKLAQLEHLQYVTALIDTLLIQKESLVSIFLPLHQVRDGLPFDPFLNHLRREGGDWFVNTRVSNILGFLLLRASRYGVPCDRVSVVTTAVMKWFASHLETSEKPEILNPLLLSLRNNLRSQSSRVTFEDFGGIEILGSHLRSPHHPIIYNAMFGLWLLSYNPDLVKKSFPRSSVVPKIVETLKTIHREKVIRICIATLVNLVEGSRENTLPMHSPTWRRCQRARPPSGSCFPQTFPRSLAKSGRSYARGSTPAHPTAPPPCTCPTTPAHSGLSEGARPTL